MSIVYRKEWTAPNNHTYRLDIVPYDTNTTASVTTLSAADANLIEVGTITDSFDELPVGLVKPSSMTLRFVLNRLPPALQTYLRNKYDASVVGPMPVYPRNTFILTTNLGSGTPTTVLFCGVQSRINSQTYTRQNGEYLVEIECVDALQYSLSTMSPGDDSRLRTLWQTNLGALSGQRKKTQIAHEFLTNVNVNPAIPARYRSWYQSSRSDEDAYFHTWTATFSEIGTTLAGLVGTIALRYTTTGTEPFDKLGAWWGNKVTDIAKFFTASRALPQGARTPVAAVAANGLYLLTNIVQDGNLVGGLAARGDKYGWGRYESYWDLFKDLCECLFLKANYVYEIGTGADAGKVFVTWFIEPVLSNTVDDIDIMDSLDEPEILETEPAIARAEVRYQAEYGDATVTQLVANAGTVRADRQYTVDSPMHNNPLFKPKRPRDVFENGMLHCNLLWFRDTAPSDFGSDNIAKVHENLRLFWGTGTTEYFDYNESTVSHYPPLDKELHQTWAIGCQQVTGLPYALAQSYAALFGQDNLASMTVRLPLGDYFVRVGEVWTVSGDITTDLPHLAWSNAVVTTVETNVAEGTQSLTLLLIPNPA